MAVRTPFHQWFIAAMRNCEIMEAAHDSPEQDFAH
jgi:hypothetical protein